MMNLRSLWTEWQRIRADARLGDVPERVRQIEARGCQADVRGATTEGTVLLRAEHVYYGLNRPIKSYLVQFPAEVEPHWVPVSEFRPDPEWSPDGVPTRRY